MEKNVEILSEGLKCDNSGCDWKDTTINFENYGDWINRPCPKCGENVLTFQDYKNAEMLREMYNYLNSLTPEQIEELGEVYWDEIKNDPFFSGVEGLDLVEKDSKGCHVIEFSTHGEVKLKSIKKCEDDKTIGSIDGCGKDPQTV